jgi:hypothetical protein
MSPAKRRGAASKRLVLNKRFIRIQKEVARLKRARATVRREDFDEMSRSLRQLHKNTDDLLQHTKELDTQFTRIAQIQAQVDAIQRVLSKLKLSD